MMRKSVAITAKLRMMKIPQKETQVVLSAERANEAENPADYSANQRLSLRVPADCGGLRLDQVHRRGAGHVDDIGNRYPERGGQLAQDGEAGVGRSLFDFDQHPLAHPGPARQLIKRQSALLSVLLEPAGDGGGDMPHVGAGIGRYIDSLGHRSLS